MESRINICAIHEVLSKEFKNHKMPVVDLIQIQTKNPFKILIATILSARTSDAATVNACKKLFSRVDKYKDLDKLSVKEIERMIYPVGFYHTKAIHLKQLPDILEKEFDGKVPDNIDDLLKLPGVGRKTANLVVAIAFDKPAICVDTHVHKLMNRIGYIKTKTPLETEMALRKKLPIKFWTTINSIMVSHGQHICRSISPFCSKCRIERYCGKKGVKKAR